MIQRTLTFEVIETVNDKQERQPDRYKVNVTTTVSGSCREKAESIEFGSFQQALQAFINRLH